MAAVTAAGVQVQARRAGGEGGHLHDLHVWTITSGIHAVSVHVVLAEGVAPAVADAEVGRVAEAVAEEFLIIHTITQVERGSRQSEEPTPWLATVGAASGATSRPIRARNLCAIVSPVIERCVMGRNGHTSNVCSDLSGASRCAIG
jgi:hypothetical protein